MKYLPKSWTAFAMIAIGVALVFTGMAQLETVGELRDRTEQRVAVIGDGTFSFTTIAGVDYTLPLTDDCKRAEPTPKRGCIERYEPGDEVLIWFDEADPTHTWKGSTPGGGIATSALYAGIIMITFALVTLYVSYALPAIKAAAARLQDIVGRAPRP